METNLGLNHILEYFPNLNPVQTEQFRSLERLYFDWNQKVNVISRKDIDFLYERHVLHSLAIARFITFNPGTKVLDIGTGGGFPGIPLAILFPDSFFYLSDSIAKKIRVVDGIALDLGLKNILALWIRSENFTEKVDFVVSRAVAPFHDLVKWSAGKILKEQKNSLPNGLICLKGGDLNSEIKTFKSQVGIYDLKDWFREDFFLEKKLLYFPMKS